MIAQEIVMVCVMQAAQCIAQASCSDDGTVGTLQPMIVWKDATHSRLQRRQLSLACITHSTMARHCVGAERISLWLGNDL